MSFNEFDEVSLPSKDKVIIYFCFAIKMYDRMQVLLLEIRDLEGSNCSMLSETFQVLLQSQKVLQIVMHPAIIYD